MARIFKAGALYFAIVFAAGFVLGVVRTFFVAPRLGVRTAELLEAPLMVVISYFAARWVVRRPSLRLQTSALPLLLVGVFALALMLVVEFTFVLWIQGLTLLGYFARRDPVGLAAYFAALALFALMPLLAGRKD